ncbi:uncharacterized protein TNCV_4771621 [Trichonephila clavipes]|nr:uncharacterized protein TNCV_4771621 [Trichonephila clavipes]
MEFLKNRKDFFKDLRLDTALTEMLCDAREFADEIDIPANFELTQPRHRVRRRNVNFDCEAREDPIEDPTLKYKTEFYFFTLDKAINALESRNKKVSNHGSTPITIDCNVVAFIVFEEGFHQPIKRTKQSVFLDVTVFRHTLVD